MYCWQNTELYNQIHDETGMIYVSKFAPLIVLSGIDSAHCYKSQHDIPYQFSSEYWQVFFDYQFRSSYCYVFNNIKYQWEYYHNLLKDSPRGLIADKPRIHE